MSSSIRRPSREPAGLVRFLAIVLASIAGSTGCWLWVTLLLAVWPRPDGAAGPAPHAPVERIAWFLSRPMAWEMGPICGLWFALPAVACLWSRRLVPALLFVLTVGCGVATGTIAAAILGGGIDVLLVALPVTALAVLAALLFVRCVPLPFWKREPRVEPGSS